MTTRISKIRWDGRKWFKSPAGVLYRSGFAGMQQAAQRMAMRIARKAASEMAMPGG